MNVIKVAIIEICRKINTRSESMCESHVTLKYNLRHGFSPGLDTIKVNIIRHYVNQIKEELLIICGKKR
jgi:hypothetical protein